MLAGLKIDGDKFFPCVMNTIVQLILQINTANIWPMFIDAADFS